jgi:hypothetical protein
MKSIKLDSEPMQPKVTIEPDKGYILVEPVAGGDIWDLFECFGKAFQVPDYPDANSIWVIPDGPLTLNYDDLYRIREMLLKNYPENAKPNRKVAIVVQTGLLTAMANEYIRIVEDLPIEFQVFPDLPTAEQWII